MVIFDYDPTRWPLKELVVAMIGMGPLELLHEQVPRDWPGDKATFGLKLAIDIRARLTPCFLSSIAGFMRHAVPACFRGITRYQQSPVMRIHLHGGHSISGMHRDRDWGQQSSVLNLWLPFTDASDTNSLWVEPDDGVGEPRPVRLSYGQAMVFRGADLLHGSKRNTTGSTRVSCDIRFHAG